MLLDHLEGADEEGPVGQQGAGLLVDAELSSRHCLSCWDLSQVKEQLLPAGLLGAQDVVALH